MDTLIIFSIMIFFALLFVFSAISLSNDDDEFDSTKFLEEQEAEMSRHNDFS